jgi:hypothetical protein
MTNATLETPELARVLATLLLSCLPALRSSLRLSTSAPIALHVGDRWVRRRDRLGERYGLC